MEKSPDVTHTLIHSVADLRALSRYLIEVMELQLHERELRRHDQAFQLVDDTAELLRSHVAQLDQQLSRLGDAEPALRTSTGALAGAFIGFFSKARPHEAAKMLRDDCTLLRFASTSYLLLHSTARALRHPELADLATTHYRELTAAAQKLQQHLPRLVVGELSAWFGGIDRSAVEQTRALAADLTPVSQPDLAATA